MVLIVTAAVFSYLVSGKTGGMRRGVIERLGRYIPLQSVKILVVAWQILTQVSSVVVIGDTAVSRVGAYGERLWGAWHP